MQLALLFSVFVIASCGLLYELVAAALSSYLLGDSVTQFSIIIGVYLFAMGCGSYLSRFVVTGVVQRFIQIELLVGLVGGLSSLILFFAFVFFTSSYQPLLYALVLVLGILVGLEIPLVMRILKRHYNLRNLVSEVLTFDYLGALAVSLAFPLLLVPQLGLLRTSFLFGLMNSLVAALSIVLFRHELGARRLLTVFAVLTSTVLAVGLVFAERLTDYAQARLYRDDVLMASSSPYQRIVVTRWQDDIRLHLNNTLQFSSRDEYRYHEALVHPALAGLPQARHVLVLGGGDGLAVREILRYPQIESITLVDLDAQVTDRFRDHPLLNQLNDHSLSHPKVRVINQDAFIWLQQQNTAFDFIVVDFPDPTNYSIGKLYTTAFYRLLERHLSEYGRIVVQATSPLFARRSYWCVVNTLENVDLKTAPYHALVPSFGEWGFIIAARQPFRLPQQYPPGLRFLDTNLHDTLFLFPADMARMPTAVNQLSNQILVRYHEEDWAHYAR